jgi:hypothetical protein
MKGARGEQMKDRIRRPEPIPPFKTLEEEAKFWDTHDLADLFKGRTTVEEMLAKDEIRSKAKRSRRDRSREAQS